MHTKASRIIRQWYFVSYYIVLLLLQITLSDEQYNLLEQKGWILLESNDKIFVLDTLGLHDITDNDSEFR